MFLVYITLITANILIWISLQVGIFVDNNLLSKYLDAGDPARYASLATR